MEGDFYGKYLKYKKKYLELKNRKIQRGGNCYDEKENNCNAVIVRLLKGEFQNRLQNMVMSNKKDMIEVLDFIGCNQLDFNKEWWTNEIAKAIKMNITIFCASKDLCGFDRTSNAFINPSWRGDERDNHVKLFSRKGINIIFQCESMDTAHKYNKMYSHEGKYFIGFEKNTHIWNNVIFQWIDNERGETININDSTHKEYYNTFKNMDNKMLDLLKNNMVMYFKKEEIINSLNNLVKLWKIINKMAEDVQIVKTFDENKNENNEEKLKKLNDDMERLNRERDIIYDKMGESTDDPPELVAIQTNIKIISDLIRTTTHAIKMKNTTSSKSDITSKISVILGKRRTLDIIKSQIKGCNALSNCSVFNYEEGVKDKRLMEQKNIKSVNEIDTYIDPEKNNFSSTFGKISGITVTEEKTKEL
jgi:hypothetical protein